MWRLVCHDRALGVQGRPCPESNFLATSRACATPPHIERLSALPTRTWQGHSDCISCAFRRSRAIRIFRAPATRNPSGPTDRPGRRRQMFASNVVGLASASAAGLGNCGGGVALAAMPEIFAVLKRAGFTNDAAWRCCNPPPPTTTTTTTPPPPPVLPYICGTVLYRPASWSSGRAGGIAAPIRLQLAGRDRAQAGPQAVPPIWEQVGAA